MALLAEVAERDARGRTKSIYGEIRHLGGVPMVALIFRHLATLPGGLEWAWDALEPAWRCGRLQEAAWRIAREAPVARLLPMPREALALLGVDEAALQEIHVVLDAYNRANPENLLSVLTLQRLVGGASVVTANEGRSWTPPEAPGPLVEMTEAGRMPPEVARLLEIVCPPRSAGTPSIVPSLYRHLVHHPGYLALAVTLLNGGFRDGSFERSVLHLQRAMTTCAGEIAKSLRAPCSPHADVALAFERFGGGVIAQMIVVGASLEQALP